MVKLVDLNIDHHNQVIEAKFDFDGEIKTLIVEDEIYEQVTLMPGIEGKTVIESIQQHLLTIGLSNDSVWVSDKKRPTLEIGDPLTIDSNGNIIKSEK